jgi:hypothetical protein
MPNDKNLPLTARLSKSGVTSNLQLHYFLLTLSRGTVAKQSKPLLLKPAERWHQLKNDKI